MPFSEETRKYLVNQGYKWVRNSKDLGEIEKIALQYYDTTILHNRATGTYSLYVFGRKIYKPMFGKFEVAGVIVKDNEVEVIPTDGPAMHFKDITSFEDEKVEHFNEAEETIVEELEERDVPPEEWENYGIGPEVVERVKKKKRVREASLVAFGVEPMWVKDKKGKKRPTIFAFGEKSIDVRSVPTTELEEALKTSLFQGFQLKSEDIEIIKEEIRRRGEEELEMEKRIVKKGGEKTACPECSAEVEGRERWWAHLKIHHPKIYEALKAEERAERRRRAKERAREIPEEAKFIARALNIDVFTSNSILNRILSQDLDWKVVDWEAIAERDWRNRYDRDEYLRQIEERVARYGINLHPVEEEAKREIESLQEEFETDQLENLMNEIYIEGLDEERVEFLKGSKDFLIGMAQRGNQRAKVALADFFPDVPMEQYLRPEEMKGRKGPPKISPKDIKIDREIAKQLDDKTLEDVLRRRKLFGRVLLKKEAEIFAEELEMRRLERGEVEKKPWEMSWEEFYHIASGNKLQDLQTREAQQEFYRVVKEGGRPNFVVGVTDRTVLREWYDQLIAEHKGEPIIPPERERQIAEAKALIAPMMTSQLEEMLETGKAFGRKLEPWAVDIIKEELKRREEAAISVLHGEDYSDVLRLIAKAGTITEFDEILRNIADKRYRLTPADELELQTMAIEKRGKREVEIEKIEEPKKPPEKEPERGGPGIYPEPFIEMVVCTTCGVTSPNLDYDSRYVVSQLLRLPIGLLDSCQRCVIGVYGYADILTYISEAVADPRRYHLTRSDLNWLRRVERTIKESPVAVMFEVPVETAGTLGAWLYKHYKGEVLNIGMSNVFVTHKEEITNAFGREVAEEPGAAKIASAMLIRDYLMRKPLKEPGIAMDAVIHHLFPKFMMDWVEYGFDYVLEHHNITACSMLSRFGFRVEPTGELVFGRPRCFISDDVREELMSSLINMVPDYEVEEVETR